MFKCDKCKKEFKYKSKLKEHENRKLSCINKKEYKCEVCKIECKKPSELIRHKNTKRCKQKHIEYNITNITNNNQTYNINNIQNNIHLTLQTNGFSNTNIELLHEYIIEYLLNEQGIKNSLQMLEEGGYIDKIFILEQSTKILVSELIKILNFNINYEKNHNCKVLLLSKSKYTNYIEYHILEMNNQNNYMIQFVKYEEFIKILINLMIKIKNKFNKERLNKIINFMLDNEELLLNPIIKKNLEDNLLEMYTTFKKEKELKELENKNLMEQLLIERNKML